MSAQPANKLMLTGPQLAWSAACAGLPIGLLLVLMVVKPDYTRVLTTDPLGIRMAVSAVAILGIGLCCQAALFWLINQQLSPAEPSHVGKRLWLSLIVAGASFIVFVAPAVFTVLVGPAAVNIMQQMKK